MPTLNFFDKRHIPTRTLVDSLTARNPKLRESAIYALQIRKVQASFTHVFGRLALDRKQTEGVRIYAIQLLGGSWDRRALPYLRHIAHDPTDNICRRGDALEQMTNFPTVPLFDEFIAFLSDSSPDMRFWAVFCLSGFLVDVTPALRKIDQIVAYDHTVPECFGWHVDREALLPYERVYFNLLFPQTLSPDHDDYQYPPRPILISPMPEYDDFIRQYRSWQRNWKYETTPTPPATLKVDAEWLMVRIREQWPTIELNVREPRPTAYKFDFKLVRGQERLIGGLHRDGYAIILTGDDAITKDFAAWYRTIIDISQPLFVYEWAGQGVPLI